MIYLIGGPPRCGKSMLGRKLRQHVDGKVLSGDSILRSLQEFMEPEWLPDLFETVFDPYRESDPIDKRIDRLRRRDEVLWQFLVRYLEANDYQSGDDVVIDGLLWPDFISGITFEHKAVFLVDTSPDHARRVREIRDSDGKNNWMKDRGYSDEKIIRWAEFNIQRGRRTIELCKQYDYVYFDIADGGIDTAQQKALDYLLGR